jgi:hypothetical protein
MKKILLLSSIFCVFLSACGNASIPATPTSTLPPATATAQPPASPTTPPTATEVPTIAPTEEPAKVETRVKEIPFVESSIVFSEAFDKQIIEDEANGKFPRNPNPKPLSSIDFKPKENQNFFEEYGITSIFGISKTDAQAYKTNSNKPWSLAKVVQTEIGGQKFFVTVTRWENKDGSDGSKTPPGFTKEIFIPYDPKVKDLMTEEGFIRAYGTGAFIPSGGYINLNRVDRLKGYFSREGIDSNALIEWYRNNQEIFFNQNFWEQCEKNGVIGNLIDVNGQKKLFIPTSLIYTSAY